MRLVANKLVATAWNDLKLVINNEPNQQTVVVSLGSKFVRDAKLFRSLFPRERYPNVRFLPQKND